MCVAFVVLAVIPGAPIKGSNRTIFGIGALAIVAGFVLLGIGPASNPLSLTVGPVLLVLGYCVVIPISLLRRPGDSSSDGK